MKILRVLFLFLFFSFVFPLSVSAQGKPAIPKPTPTPQVTITTGSSVFKAGETIVIDEPVDGDVYCAGQSVTIKASVSGDVLCAAQTLTIEGEVLGSVRVVGQHINLATMIGRNATVLGQSITLPQDGSIAGELLAAGQTITVNGAVGQWVKAAGQSVSLNGQIGGDVSVAAETLTIGDDASIDGSLTYQATKQGSIPATAHIGGAINFTPIEQKVPKNYVAPTWPRNTVGSILIFMGIGLLIVIFAPKLFSSVIGPMKEKPLMTLLIGIVGVVGIPVALLVLTLTIIGIPVALLVGMCYAVVMMVAKLFVAMVVGTWVLEALMPKAKENLVYQVLVGVPITFLTLKMPFIGAVLSPFALFWGTGGIISSILARRKKRLVT